VNLAARLEKRAASLGRTIVASAEFAARAPGEFVPLGEFVVAGITAPQMVFGLAETTPRPADRDAAQAAPVAAAPGRAAE
jgi:adenylate cyclase